MNRTHVIIIATFLLLLSLNLPAKADGQRAVWYQGGVGLSGVAYSFSKSPMGYSASTAGLHVVYNNYQYALGLDAHGGNSKRIRTIWLTFGRNHHAMGGEFSITPGISYSYTSNKNQFEEQTNYHIFPRNFGMLVRANFMLHFPQALGVGLEITYNYSFGISYTLVSVYFALGSF